MENKKIDLNALKELIKQGNHLSQTTQLNLISCLESAVEYLEYIDSDEADLSFGELHVIMKAREALAAIKEKIEI